MSRYVWKLEAEYFAGYMYNWLRNYFAFSPSEMRGAVVLICLMMLLWFSPYIYQPLLTDKYEALAQDRQTMDSLVQLMEGGMVKNVSIHELSPKLLPFDPNTVKREDLLSMGISDEIASRIIKYRDSGGKFRIKKDLQKIYGLSADTYARLALYITLPDTQQVATKAKKIERLDINRADTTQLIKLRGIGTVLSARIIKFRNVLGGFYAVDQLREVYGISELALESLQKYTFVAPDFVPQQLNINEADFKTLVRHPYISYEMTKAILNHRETYGAFTDKSHLKEIPAIADSTFNKLKPYIAF